MELPIELRLALEEENNTISLKQLVSDAINISDRYRNESGKGKRLLTKYSEAVAYANVRMPATYGAVSSVLKSVTEFNDFDIKTVLDIGAGTGAATWAVDSYFNIEKVTCLEREENMIKLGEKLMQSGEEAIQHAEWISSDVNNIDLNDKKDLVITSYVLNEMSEDLRIKTVDKMWACTNKLMIIVETGTPVGFNHLKKIREHLIEKGAYMVAPCPHSYKCAVAEDDWCHFTCRIARTKVHKLLKDATVPYEDEKFCYLAFSKEKCEKADSRILRHPIVESGVITLSLCTEVENKVLKVTKKDKQMFKLARKSKCGESFPIQADKCISIY